MSSFSSMMSTTGASSSETGPNNVRNYVCPKCNRNYDFQMAGNNFVGRIPLILNCKHSVCQECVYKMYPSKDIICPECHTSNFISDSESKKKADQVFAVNFYVFGALTYQKRYGYDTSGINFKPAGFQFKHPQHNRGQQDYKPNTFLSFNVSLSPQSQLPQFNFKPEECQYVCTQENCKKEAKISCADCDEMYCKQCSDRIHKAKGLKSHKLSPLGAGNCLELAETCLVHADVLIEFICETCDKNLCCYCIVSEHNGHTFHQLTKLEGENAKEFRTLVENAEEVLKRLMISEKKVKRLLQKPPKKQQSASDTSLELTISRKIENAIAKLQMLERELLNQAQQYKNHDRTSLTNVLDTLLTQIRSVSNLVNVGKQILQENKRGEKKLNIHLVKKQLEGVSDTACYFLHNGGGDKDNAEIEFAFEDTLIEDLQHSAKINFTEANSYSLVTRTELPPDYEEEDEVETVTSNRSLFSAASSLIDSINGKEKEKNPKKNQKFDNVQKWVQSTHNPCPPQRKLYNNAKDRDVGEMPTFQKGDRETVKVTYLSSPDCFYVQLYKLNGALTRLARNIDKHVRSNSIVMVQVPEINTLYLVKYLCDGVTHWCRGRIIEEIPAQKIYVVYFIDYGNTGTVRREDIAMIPAEMKRTVPFAIKCKFFDLYPPKGEWDPKAVYLMTKIIANNELLMIIAEASPEILEVDLITTNCDTSVRDALKFLGYAIPYCKYPTDLDKIRKQLKCSENAKLYNRTEQYKKEDTFEVIVTYAIDPYNIYVNHKTGRSDLAKLHDAMHAFYRENKKGYVYSPKEEMVVAVFYSDGISSSWRRGTIIQSTEGRGMVTARLVDIGMVITVPWDQIRKLDARFVAQDCQAKLVKLTHVVPPNGGELWPQNAIDYFTKFIKAETVLKMVVNETTNPPGVVLFECHPVVHLCLNAILVKDGLARSTGDLSATVEWPQYEHETPKTDDESFTMSMLKTIQATNHHQEVDDKDLDSDEEEMSENMWRKSIEVISCESPDSIHVSFTDRKEAFHVFQLELKHHYAKNKLKQAKWEIGNVCVVYHKKRYYRGIIAEIDKDRYVVTLSDCATNVEVRGRHLGVLEEKFTREPEFAIRCHLADITPAGGTGKWSAMAREFLQDLVGNNDKLYLAKKGAIDKHRKSMPVVIWYTEFLPGGALETSKTILHSVNKILLKNGLALKVPASKAPETETKMEKVGVTLKGNERGERIVEREGEEDNESVASASTETEDHECSSSSSRSSLSVAGALKPSTSEKMDWNELIEMQKQCPERIIRDWLDPVPFKRGEFTAVPTSVNDKGEIFLHHVALEPLLQDMEENMLQYFESRGDSDVDLDWLPGEMCSVRYFQNKKWYRGKVLSANGDLIKVIMVDYGNEDDCNIRDLSKEILYYNLPAFANRIVLDNVYPKENKWLTRDLDVLHAQIVDKQVDVRLTTQQIVGLPTPAVVKLGSINVNDYMLEYSKNLTRFDPALKSSASAEPTPITEIVDCTRPRDDPESQSDNDAIIEETDSSEEAVSVYDDVNIDDMKLGYKQFPLPVKDVGEKFDIVVINMATYNRIIFEIPSGDTFEKGSEQFEKMSEDINLVVPHLPALKSYQVRQMCVARYDKDDKWYRGQIVKDVGENEAYVWFVDFGNFEKVKLADMKELQEEWLQLPIDHHLAVIDGIQVKDDKDIPKVIEKLVSESEGDHMCYTAEVVAHDPLRVKLYKRNSPTLAYQNLIDSGLLQLTIDETEQDETIEKTESEGSGDEGKDAVEVEEDHPTK